MNSYFIGPNLFSVAPEPLPQLLLSKQISPLRTKLSCSHPENENKTKNKTPLTDLSNSESSANITPEIDYGPLLT